MKRCVVMSLWLPRAKVRARCPSSCFESQRISAFETSHGGRLVGAVLIDPAPNHGVAHHSWAFGNVGHALQLFDLAQPLEGLADGVIDAGGVHQREDFRAGASATCNEEGAVLTMGGHELVTAVK